MILLAAIVTGATSCNPVSQWTVQTVGQTCVYTPNTTENTIKYDSEMFTNALHFELDLQGKTLETPTNPTYVTPQNVTIMNGKIVDEDIFYAAFIPVFTTFQNMTFETCNFAPSFGLQKINIYDSIIDTKNKTCSMPQFGGWINTYQGPDSDLLIDIDNLTVKNSTHGPGTWTGGPQNPLISDRTANGQNLLSCGMPPGYQSYAQVLPEYSSFEATVKNSKNENYNRNLESYTILPFVFSTFSQAAYVTYGGTPVGAARHMPATAPPPVAPDQACAPGASLPPSDWLNALSSASQCTFVYIGNNSVIDFNTLNMQGFETLILHLQGKTAQNTGGNNYLPTKKLTLINGIVKHWHLNDRPSLNLVLQDVTIDTEEKLILRALQSLTLDNVIVKSTIDQSPLIQVSNKQMPLHLNNITIDTSSNVGKLSSSTVLYTSQYLQTALLTLNEIPVISCVPSPYPSVAQVVDLSQSNVFVTGTNYNPNFTQNYSKSWNIQGAVKTYTYTFHTDLSGMPYQLQSVVPAVAETDFADFHTHDNLPAGHAHAGGLEPHAHPAHRGTPASTWAALGLGVAGLLAV